MRKPVDLSGRKSALAFAAKLMVSLAAAGGLAGWLLHRPPFHWPELLWLVYGWYPVAGVFGRGASSDGDTLTISRPFRTPVRVAWRDVVTVRPDGRQAPHGWQVHASDGRRHTVFTGKPSTWAQQVLSSAPHADLDPYLRDLARPPVTPYRLDRTSRLLTAIALLGPFIVVGAAALAFR